MTVVVENSTDQVAAAQNGGVFPVPADVKADNEARAAKAEGKETPKDAPKEEAKTENPDPAVEAQKALEELDNQEGEDGLTPKQKREFTKAMQATIGKKHRMQREAEELALREYNQRQLADQRARDLEAELARIRTQKPEPVVEAKAPAREDFKDDQSYLDAMIDHRVKEALKTKAQEDAERERERQQQEIVAHAAARIERAIELVPDFKEVTEAVDTPVPPHIANYMARSPMLAELGYHFAKNPDVLEKLSKLERDEALVAIGEIKSTLQPFAATAKVKDGEEPSQNSHGEKPSTETGSAPSKPRIQAPIIRPLSAGSAPQVEQSEAEMNTPQALKAWQKKHGVTLTARKRH